jgi:carbonic anhydrase
VRAALLPPEPSLPHVNRRIAPLCTLAKAHREELQDHESERERVNRLAELNVLEQVRGLRAHPVVREADTAPLVHGWIFALEDGRIKVLTSGYEADDAMTCTTAAHSAAA